jgi:hypothetical protein
MLLLAGPHSEADVDLPNLPSVLNRSQNHKRGKFLSVPCLCAELSNVDGLGQAGKPYLLGTDVGALFRYRAFHKQHQDHERQAQDCR